MSFEDQIQQWVHIDTQLKKYNDATKELRSKKHDLSNKLLKIASDEEYLHTQINISDGKLRFVETKQTAPITLSFVKTCLGEIIPDEQKVAHIIEHIKSRRDTKIVSEIKRTYK